MDRATMPVVPSGLTSHWYSSMDWRPWLEHVATSWLWATVAAAWPTTGSFLPFLGFLGSILSGGRSFGFFCLLGAIQCALVSSLSFSICGSNGLSLAGLAEKRVCNKLTARSASFELRIFLLLCVANLLF